MTPWEIVAKSLFEDLSASYPGRVKYETDKSREEESERRWDEIWQGFRDSCGSPPVVNRGNCCPAFQSPPPKHEPAKKAYVVVLCEPVEWQLLFDEQGVFVRAEGHEEEIYEGYDEIEYVQGPVILDIHWADPDMTVAVERWLASVGFPVRWTP